MTDNVIIVHRIRVTGERTCDYKLDNGLNVFKGSNSTGKTTLMWFLDYAFGGQSRSFVPEVQTNCDSIFIDMTINGRQFTVKRSIQNPKTVCIYDEIKEDIATLTGKQCTTYSLSEKSSDKKSINEFYFNQLEINPWEIPFSASKSGDFSWRQLMTFIYIPQNRWDFQATMEMQPLVRKAVFEIFMGVDNQGLREKQIKVIHLKQSKDELMTKLKSISQLLSAADRDKGSEKHIGELGKQITELEDKKRRIQNALELKSESNTLIQSKKSLEIMLEDYTIKKSDLDNKLADLQMLYSENELTLQKNRVLLKAKKIFSELPISKCPKCFNEIVVGHTEEVCPVCHQDYKDRDAESDFGQNLFLLMDDQKELTSLISGIQIEIDAITTSMERNKTKLDEFNEKINQMNKELIAPIVKETEAIDVILYQANRNLGQAEHANSLLNEENKIRIKIDDAIHEMKKLEQEIFFINKADSSELVIKKRFIDLLSHILKDILHLEEEVIDLDVDYLPIFKESINSGRSDVEKSKSLKKILGYYTAVLEYSLRYGSWYPKLLLLDTPRQEELDFTIFGKIIDYWGNLRNYGKQYQIIITGSEFPPETKLITEFHNPKESGDTTKPAKFVVM